MELDDPWHWSVDRVIRELCTPDRSWQLPPSTSIPELTEFEGILREQGITGSILLRFLDDNVLRADFNLRTWNQRVFIHDAIEELRVQSAQYQAHMDRQNRIRSPSIRGSAMGGFYPSLSSPGPNSAFPFGDQHQTWRNTPPVAQTNLQAPMALPYSPPATYSSELLQDHRKPPLLTDRCTIHHELDISDEPRSQQPRLDMTTEIGDAPDFHAASIAQSEIQQPSVPVDEPTAMHLPNPDSKKRKRIAPTLISSDISLTRDRQIPTEADTVLHNNPENVEPGVPFVTEDGRKRLVPIHQQSPYSESSYNYNDLLQRSRLSEQPPVDKISGKDSGVTEIDRKKHGLPKPSSLSFTASYLGKQKLTVDELFYEGIAVGQELPFADDSAELSSCHKKLPSGRRLYVHRIIKGFLRSEPKVFKRDGDLFYAVQPYRAKLAPKFHGPSFTLFHVNSIGKVSSRREEVPHWPEISPNASSQLPGISDDDYHIHFNMGVLGETSSYAETFDPDYLAKYKYIPGGDEVLPIYGESDEENEYDLETWTEMEKERNTSIEMPVMSLKKPLLASGVIDQAIDETITALVTKWRSDKLPKIQQKALQLWKKFRKDRGARRSHIEHLQQIVDRINEDRIPEMRQEILGELWSSQNQVRKQSCIMEQSIYDRESSMWEINMLKSRVPPAKPEQKASAVTSPKYLSQAQVGTEGESVGSDSDAPTFDGSEASLFNEDMGDFIVEDTPSIAEDIEMNLADTEDEDGTTSDSSTSYITAHATPTAMTDLLAKNETSLPDIPPTSPNTADNPIDLTILSSDDAPGTPTINLVTPKKKPRVRLIHKGSPFAQSPIAISDEEMAFPDIDNLPPYDDPDAIAKFSHGSWASISDRERLLISVVNELDEDQRAAMFTFVSSVAESELWSNMLEILHALLDGKAGLKGVDSTTFQTLVGFIRLFNIYATCKYQGLRPLPASRLRKVPELHTKWFQGFYLLCQKLEGYFSTSALADVDDDDDDDEPITRHRRSVDAVSDDDIQGQGSHHWKRKRKIIEDKEARDMREHDRQRLEQQDERRKKLQKKLPSLEYADGQHKIIINDGKYEHQGFIHVTKEIALRIKQHQIEGVRFMWGQIVTDEMEMQGCLLAHTMGLGKTMQVITLLCAIAEASKSPDESVYSQVPLSLRSSKTLVLCPAGLIDNWMDELLTWAPKGLLGGFRRVDKTLKLPERLQTIDNWFCEGGILIIGYEMFRGLCNNNKTETREPALSEEDHKTVKGQLLDGPNIIVADEAHKMKNAKSGLTRSTAQFKSRSRIALTGSPLANNVEEYHTMIEWIAPGYLGPAVEFRATYVEPIQEGLWHDSTRADRRKSLMLLDVLTQEVAPKIHRADMSVLRNDLPPKKEFVITVPLTELQHKAYTLYVQSMTSGNKHITKNGDFLQTTVWHWLNILSLLCNHPDCFNKKLHERKEDAGKDRAALKSKHASRSSTDQDDDMGNDPNAPIGKDLNKSIWKVGVSQELVNQVTDLFRKETSDLKAIDFSNKAKILCQILDASKSARDKVLVFSQSLPTLNFLEELCITQHRTYFRLDGSTPIHKRQEFTKTFNTGDTEIYLISTAAGGLGLNIFGANRVVIFDFKFNPIMEEQAIGRAYRIGQQKPVFVYRFVAGGTFEDSVHNKAVFKTQLSSRVVDKKNPIAWARKRLGEMLFEPKVVEQRDLSEFVGMDPLVLDAVLASQAEDSTIRAIVQTDTFERNDDDTLTADEKRESKRWLDDSNLKRSNPKAFHELVLERNLADRYRQMGLSAQVPGIPTNSGSTSAYAVPGTNPENKSPTARSLGASL